MAKFTDRLDREWEVDFWPQELTRIKEESGINPLSLFDDEFKLFAEIFGDTETAVDFLWCICAPQAQANNIDVADFNKGLNQGVIEEGIKAIADAVIEYMPEKKREAARAALAKIWEVEAAMADKTTQRVNGALQSLDVNKTATDILNSLGSSQAQPV